MTRLLLAASALGLFGLAACDNTTDDVVQAPAPGAAPVAVSDIQAQTAQTTAALAFGMTRAELEDADVLSPANTDLGDVETLVLNANGDVESIVVELEGPGDREVVVPIAQFSSISQGNDKDLTTTLSATELAALPVWTGAAATR
ncbi:PRC-barrel domain-containing protein [Brevundimonas variabilis]|uniref:PRC-barrel domain-containing protein n=1 Tax=Brevundimonas variabilis TaxID=74312 RepID=A0A7W9CII6_9CAUL|nr:PRC-barrel domain-containing protein [Brevundimonas variabilis]MBB5746091.1 hypothetical protein [Brevundimonas variabilis]